MKRGRNEFLLIICHVKLKTIRDSKNLITPFKTFKQNIYNIIAIADGRSESAN